MQFSSAFCAPCRATRQLLTLVAAQSPDVRHVEIDAESHLELVRALGIARTPTTLVLDAAGRETARITGLPRRDAVDAATGVSHRETGVRGVPGLVLTFGPGATRCTTVNYSTKPRKRPPD